MHTFTCTYLLGFVTDNIKIKKEHMRTISGTTIDLTESERQQDIVSITADVVSITAVSDAAVASVTNTSDANSGLNTPPLPVDSDGTVAGSSGNVAQAVIDELSSLINTSESNSEAIETGSTSAVQECDNTNKIDLFLESCIQSVCEEDNTDKTSTPNERPARRTSFGQTSELILGANGPSDSQDVEPETRESSQGDETQPFQLSSQSFLPSENTMEEDLPDREVRCGDQSAAATQNPPLDVSCRRNSVVSGCPLITALDLDGKAEGIYMYYDKITYSK